MRTRTAGPPRTRRSTARAASPMTCSALSSTTSTSRLPARCSASGLDACSLASPSSATTAAGTSSPSSSRASSTILTPRPRRVPATLATSRARRVLPTPPGPTSVTTRAVSSSSATCSRSVSRPTKEDATTGGSEALDGAGSTAGTGADPCSPNAPSSTACSARRRRGDGSSPASASAAGGALEGPERLGVPVGPRQPLHEHGPAPFTKRLPGHQRLGGGDGLGLAARLEQHPGVALGDLAPALVQPPGLGAHARTVGFLGVGGTTPELERLLEQRHRPGGAGVGRFPGQQLEQGGVGVARTGHELVARALGRERVADLGPQPRDVGPQRGDRRLGRIVAPQGVDQGVDGDDLRRAGQQRGQQPALAGTADRARRTVVTHHLQGAEDTEPHDANRRWRPSRPRRAITLRSRCKVGDRCWRHDVARRAPHHRLGAARARRGHPAPELPVPQRRARPDLRGRRRRRGPRRPRLRRRRPPRPERVLERGHAAAPPVGLAAGAGRGGAVLRRRVGRGPALECLADARPPGLVAGGSPATRPCWPARRSTSCRCRIGRRCRRSRATSNG